MANGILVIDKSAGWTSQDVAAKLRGVFHERRVGHGGTLDPMATGVLPVFIGRATRAAEFLESAEKEYVAGLRLGVVTDTQDTSGTVLETNPVCVTRAQLEAALRQFLGPIEQIPPMYSAIKINGQKLYELARRGQEVARRPRSITIHALELLEGEGADWTVRVRCSKGTYVRTLCHDLGRALGCGGCMSSLRRTRAGSFTLAQAVTMQQVLDFAVGQDLSMRSSRRIRPSSSRWGRPRSSKTARRSRTGSSSPGRTASMPRTANFCCSAAWRAAFSPPSRAFSR